MNRGFTLIEVVVSVGIFSVLIYGVIALVSSMIVTSDSSSTLLSNNDTARKVAFTLTSELRNSVPSATGAYPLGNAADQQLIFFSDTGATVDRIRYFIQSGMLYKGVTKPSGNPVTYNLANETITLIQRDIANGATPLFYYYNDDYDGVSGTPLTQPVNVTQVNNIKLNLMVYRRASKTSTAVYTVTASGTIRSLKTNLGE